MQAKHKAAAGFTVLVGLPALLVASSGRSAEAKETPQREGVHNGVVIFQAVGMPDPEQVPLIAMDLSEVIKRYPLEKKFKVFWDYAVGGGSGRGHVVYDRTAHTIRTFTVDKSAGYREDTKHFMFSSVTDEVLHRLAEDVKNRERPAAKVNSDAMYFDQLHVYGCPRRMHQVEILFFTPKISAPTTSQQINP